MKKLIGLFVVVLLAIGGKCYYQKSKLQAFLDGMREYGYSYKVKSSSLCSMDVAIYLSEPKKLLSIYPKFLRENKKFMEQMEKEFKEIRISKDEQLYNINFPLFSFDIVAKSTYKTTNAKLKGEYGKVIRYLSDKKLIKITTTCSTLTNKCVSVYDDIDTTYEDLHIVTKGVVANFEFKDKRSMIGDFNIKYLNLKGDSVDFDLNDLKVDILYNDTKTFNLKEIFSIGSIGVKDKNSLNAKIKDITFGGAYFENKNAFFKFKAKEIHIPDNSLDLDIKDIDFLLTIDKESGFKFNIESFDFIGKTGKKLDIKLKGLKSSYTFLDNNIYISKGKTKLDSLYIKNWQNETLLIKNFALQSKPEIKDDRLKLHEVYSLELLDFKLKKTPFKVAGVKLDLAVKDIGYSVIKEFYNELMQVYKKAFIAGFNGDNTAAQDVRRELNMISMKYAGRLIEIFKYGIKIDLNEFSIKEIDYKNKSAKDLELTAKVELLKITMQDILSKKYNQKRLPIKSLKAKAKIPNELLELNNINESMLPFKFKVDKNHKIIDIDYKDGVIYLNDTPMR